MKTAIAELERTLEALENALKGANETYAQAEREASEAAKRSHRAFDARAKIAQNRDRVAKAIKLLKEIELLKEGGEAS